MVTAAVLLPHFFQLAKSSSNLNEIVYGGRPRNEDPHVKRTVKKKEEKIEYIVRVDLDELKIDDDDFDDLQSLYQGGTFTRIWRLNA